VNKPRKLGFLSVFGLVVVATGFLALRTREPAYQGRRLSEWLNDLPVAGGYPVAENERTRAKELALQLGTNAPDWLVSISETLGQIPEKEPRARDAVRQIGTNAIPALLRMLQYKQSPLKRTLARIISKQSFVRFHISAAHVRPMFALSGFFALGSEAKSAIPELVALLHNGKDGTVAHYAGLALAGLGPEALPQLTFASTNGDRLAQNGAVNGLFLAGPVGPLASESHRVAPVLITCLNDPDASIRGSAASALGQMLTEPESVVPALIETLQGDRSSDVRLRAADSLGGFKSRAKPAAPALLNALNDQDPNVRYITGEALKQIDPEAATKAGVK